MSEGRGGAGNSHGSSVPSGRASPHSSSTLSQQQQRTYSNTNQTRGSASYNGSHPRRGGETEGRGRGQGSRLYNEPRVCAPQYLRGGERRPFSAAPSNSVLASFIEEAPRTKTASYVTPHDAVQPQPAQHGATVVRSGSSATEGGSVLFFSSVQKKGGAFTASERETYAQLHRSRAIPNVSRGRNAGNVTGSGVSAKSVARQYADLERSREERALAQAQTAVTRSKRSRFALNDSLSDTDDAEANGSDAEAPTKRTAARSS
ncbi:hypothetical protein CUR178_05607 [Leishmania enriettii]|uniref:Uncharacterized protein n=1 Tax=Leishmania enriettii TaxID=5663 RepID=A0A836KYD2_LEIEN|nr:hypothetical protein CUR178_05607 [Leishmania enriettii]